MKFNNHLNYKIMKKLYLIIVVFLSITTLSIAQNENKKTRKNRFDFGFYGGLASTKFESKLFKAEEIKTRWSNAGYWGAYLRLNLDNRLYVQSGANYIMCKTDFMPINDKGIGKEAVTHKEYFLDVPILVGIRVIKSDVLNLRIYSGPVASFDLPNKIDEIKEAKDLKFKQSGWNAKVGAGVDFLIFSLDADYQFKLDDHFMNAFKKNNKLVNVTLGIFF